MELLQLSHDLSSFHHCPFNLSHTMPHKTLIKHIAKCPDRPPNFKNCPFNMSHVMHESELKNHEENCPNRILIDTAVFESEDIVRPKPVISSTPKLEYEESWDGLEHTSDVLKDIKKTSISMKAIHGNTKSERKNHRKFLHERDVSYSNGQQDNVKLVSKASKTNTMKNNYEEPLFIGKRPPMKNN